MIYGMATKKATAKKDNSLAEGREQIALIIDSDIAEAMEVMAQRKRLKRNPLIQLACIEYLERNGYALPEHK